MTAQSGHTRPETCEIEFIQTLKTALGRTAPDQTQNARDALQRMFDTEPENRSERLKACLNKDTTQKETLLNLFIENGARIHTTIVPVPDVKSAGLEIASFIRESEPEWRTDKAVMQWDHPLIEQLNLETVLKDSPIQFFKSPAVQTVDAAAREQFRKEVEAAYIGITSADFCVADTATLVMRTRPGQARAVSLVPSIHIAVVRQEQILENLGELYFRLQWDPQERQTGLTNCMTFISGPSKTGDIEMVMVHGAHGPRQLAIYVITEK